MKETKEIMTVRERSSMAEITIPAKVETLPIVQDFVEKILKKENCSSKTKYQIFLAVEEVYANISKYAYRPKIGDTTVRCETTEDPSLVIIEFWDNGTPFNPLSTPEPDTTLPLQERSIGGLGILLIKKNMDDVRYAYQNGYNILTMRKKIT